MKKLILPILLLTLLVACAPALTPTAAPMDVCPFVEKGE